MAAPEFCTWSHSQDAPFPCAVIRDGGVCWWVRVVSAFESIRNRWGRVFQRWANFSTSDVVHATGGGCFGVERARERESKLTSFVAVPRCTLQGFRGVFFFFFFQLEPNLMRQDGECWWWWLYFWIPWNVVWTATFAYVKLGLWQWRILTICSGFLLSSLAFCSWVERSGRGWWWCSLVHQNCRYVWWLSLLCYGFASLYWPAFCPRASCVTVKK